MTYGFNIGIAIQESLEAGVDIQDEEVGAVADTDLIADVVEDVNEGQEVEALGNEVDSASDSLEQFEQDGIALEALYDMAKMSMTRPQNPGMTVLEGLLVEERVNSIMAKYGRPQRGSSAVTENLTYNQELETKYVVEGIGETLKGWGKAAWDWLKNLWNKVKEFFKGIFNAFASGKKNAKKLREKFTERKKNNNYITEKRSMNVAEFYYINGGQDQARPVENLLKSLTTLQSEWSFQEQYNVLEEIANTAETNKEGGLKPETVKTIQKSVDKLMRKNPTGNSDSYRYNGTKAVKMSGGRASFSEMTKDGTVAGQASQSTTLQTIFSDLPFNKAIYQEIQKISLARQETSGETTKSESTTLSVPGRVLVLDNQNVNGSSNTVTKLDKKAKFPIFEETELMAWLERIEKVCDASLALQAKEKELDGMMTKLTNWFRKEENKRLNFAARYIGHNALSVSKPLLAISKRTVSAMLQACAVSMSKGFSSKADADEKKDDKPATAAEASAAS